MKAVIAVPSASGVFSKSIIIIHCEQSEYSVCHLALLDTNSWCLRHYLNDVDVIGHFMHIFCTNLGYWLKLVQVIEKNS